MNGILPLRAFLVPAVLAVLVTPALAEITPSHAVGGTHSCDNYYPTLSAQMNESGDVRVGYDVDAEGNIVHVHVVKTSGSDRLDNAAVACVATHWQNTPAMDGGTPVASPNHQAIIEFRLRSAEPAAAPEGRAGARPQAPPFEAKDIPWEKLDRGLFDTLEWVTIFFGACGFAAFVNWLINRPRNSG
jgi:TonB family protein